MQSFNPELKVGDLAMIINTTQQKNAHLLGAVVMIEAFIAPGTIIPEQYTTREAKSSTEYKRAVVSGVHTEALLIANHATLNIKHLMPLPPLDDDATIFANENEKEAVQ